MQGWGISGVGESAIGRGGGVRGRDMLSSNTIYIKENSYLLIQVTKWESNMYLLWSVSAQSPDSLVLICLFFVANDVDSKS